MPVGETGPYRLWVDGRSFPLSVAASAAAPTATLVVPPPDRRPVRDAAVTAGTAALGGTAAAPPPADPGPYHLCAQTKRYALCGERACRPDGLLSKTTLTCRVRGCAPGELPKSTSGGTPSLTSCVTACRQAQAAAEREGVQGSVPVYCAQ